MGRHFIKEGDGHYREYSEEEYQEKENEDCLSKLFLLFVGIVFCLYLYKDCSSGSVKNDEMKEDNVEVTVNPPVKTYGSSTDVLFVSDVEADATNTSEESEGQDVVFDDMESSETETNDDEIPARVDKMASFPGGDEALSHFISSNLQYPTIAEENYVSGLVIVSFVIERDGSISEITVIKSADPSLDEEAVRLVKIMPLWNPAMDKGKAVRSRRSVPFNFRLI